MLTSSHERGHEASSPLVLRQAELLCPRAGRGRWIVITTVGQLARQRGNTFSIEFIVLGSRGPGPSRVA